MVTRVSAAVAATLAAGGAEDVNFLNSIIQQLWPYIDKVTSQLVKEIVEPMFEQMLPGPLSNLKFKEINLGEKPIVLDNIDVHRRDEDVMKIDMDVYWDGDCDIQLASSMLKFGVKSVKLVGRMSFILTPLLERLPLVAAIQVGFINPPQIRLDFTGLAEIAEFSLIESTIYKILDQILAGILVLPNRILVKLDPAASWYDTFQPDLGVLRLTTIKGYGFVTPKGFLKDVPDIYARVRLGAQKQWETEAKNNDTSPEWNDTRDVLFSDRDQQITVKCLDSDFSNADDSLGDGQISAGKLLLEGGNEVTLPLVIDNVDTGAKVDIRCEKFDLTSDLSSFEAEEFSGEHLLCGVLYIMVAGLKHLPVEKEEASSFIKVKAFSETFQTMIVAYQPNALGIDYLNPCYDAGFRVALTQEMVAEAADINLIVMNKKEKLGTVVIPFGDLKDSDSATIQDEFKLGNGAVVLAKVMLKGLTPSTTD